MTEQVDSQVKPLEVGEQDESLASEQESSDSDGSEESLERAFESEGPTPQEASDLSEDDVLSPKVAEMHASMSLRAQIEAAIFASAKPMKSSDLIDLVSHEVSLKEVDRLLGELREDYEQRAGGFRLEYVKGLGYQFQSVADASPIMEKMFASRPRPLSRAAMETLAIVAYRQPATRATVEFIRGVDSGSIIKNLLERNLIKCVGRKEDAGRPMLFGTTDEFLQIFGLSSLKDLPPLQSFQPSSETMQQALDELEEVEKGVDPEGFVEDREQQPPDVSDGLLAELESDEKNHDNAASENSERMKGASLADEPNPEPANVEPASEDSEMALADGSELTAEERGADSSGQDHS